MRCERPFDLLTRPPKGINEDFGARSAVVALMIERQGYVAGRTLVRRFRVGGDCLVGSLRCKRLIDLLARLGKGGNEDFGARIGGVAFMIRVQGDVAGLALVSRFRL